MSEGLFVWTFGTKSHLGFFSAIIKALVRQGHEITLVTPYEAKFEEKNVRQIVIQDENLQKIYGNLFNKTKWNILSDYLTYSSKLCVNNLQTFLEREASRNSKSEYDFIILSVYLTDCYLGYVYESKIPFMYATPNVLYPPYSYRMGEPSFPAVYPNKLSTLSYPMTFLQRLRNTLAIFFFSQIGNFQTNRCESLARELGLWKEESPSASEIEKMASMAFINSVKALERPIKASLPNVIYVGGIHIEEPKPLPQDLKKWCDESDESGFILFSLGTAVEPQDMTNEQLEAILSVFQSLKQRIIWKWDFKRIENLPQNVKLISWLPQQDVLAHPKIRLFITHGGLSSLREASYFGVPVLGMPVFGDQMANIAEVIAENWGNELKWAELTEQTFRSAILDTMENVTIKQEVQKRSLLMRDWPFTPSKEVVYWVEYVVRHKGASNLKSPLVTMSW
ncbi:UDP-glucuronosyltransferase [Armadillidium nasatum]|uniref:UDP-glucuronosyltransferase n=1 Tax=Armadillidium nasatum TaxID=96803 RepID=A0A5N5TDK8_9CRUS|nr:UDP-glucuronosyltransferase [Armadillidium nasatum]